LIKARTIWPILFPLFGLLFLGMPASAQLKVGDNLSFGMDGTLGLGYGADYSPGEASSSSVGLNGTGNIHGFYFDPRFLTFAVSPSYNRSQANTPGEGGSLTNASSIGASAGIFGGSHFPGTVGWSKTFNSSGTYGVPGAQGFITDGNATQFGVGWSALLPNLPPVSANFSQETSTSSIFGIAQKNQSTSRNFNLQSSYRLHGWATTAHLVEVALKSETPSFLSPGETNVGSESATNLSFSTSHKLPLNGGVAMSYGYNSFSGGSGGAHESGSGDEFAASASFLPSKRFSTQFQFEYNGNLQSQVENQLIGVGSVAPQVNLGSGSHTLSFSNSDTVYLRFNLSAGFNVSRIQQEVYGTSVAADRYSAILNYHFQKPLFGTVLIYAGVNDQAADGVNEGASLSTGANFSRIIKDWDMGGSFSYQQSVQTVLALVSTSSYAYNASLNRSLTRNLHWFTNFNSFHSGMGTLAGTSNYTDGISSSVLYRAIAVAANYSKSTGISLITQNGLVAAPVSIPISLLGANQFLTTSGKSYSVSTSGSFRKLTLTGAYTNAKELTSTPTVNSANSTTVLFANASYPWRKMGFDAGYTYLKQGVGASGTAPVSYSTYYIGIQRWFKPF
jgi:hypothetical protein